jgi:hypothetical protein
MKAILLALVLAALAAGLYLPTWSPVGTWAHFGEDGPELEAAGRTLGIPHPTGYPLLMLLIRVVGLAVPPPFSALNVITLLAAVAAVVGVGFAGGQVARAALAHRERVRDLTSPRSDPQTWTEWTAGILAGAFFATSLTWWKQSVIGEVYTLHVALLSLALVIAFSATPRRLALAYLLGLGLAHHLQTLVVIAVVMIYLALRRRREPRPADGASLPPGSRMLRERLAPGLATGIAFLAPLSLYFVLLIRSRLDPPLDWGDPETLSRLWWTMSGAPYRANLFRNGIAPFLQQWGDILLHAPVNQLGWTAVVLAAAGIGVAVRRAQAEAAALILLYSGSTFVAAAYTIPDPAAYILPAILALALAAGVGGAWLVTHAFGVATRRSPWRLAPAAAAAALIAAGLSSRIAMVRKEADASRDHAAYDYAREGIAALPAGALVVSHGDGRTFSLWLGAAVLSPRPDVVILYDNLLEWSWYRGAIRRQHPDVILPPNGLPRSFRRGALIMTHLEERPVYVTELEPELAAIFTAEAAGPLFRVARRPDPDAVAELAPRPKRSRVHQALASD